MHKNKSSNRNFLRWTTTLILSIVLIMASTTGCSLDATKTNKTNETVETMSNDFETMSNSEDTEGVLKIHYINVAQGDAALIQCNGKNMLIDAGKNDKADLVNNYLKEQGIEKLDYIIGTHPHEDHIGGMDIVVDNYEIGKVIMPKVTATTRTYKDVINSINNKNLKITEPKVGTTYELGQATFEILAPNSSSYKDTNNYSVSIKLTFGDNRFIFTGDAEDASEEEMLLNGLELKADVLKVGHHGSYSSTTDEFLAAVNPEYAVISVGEVNDYGHPHDEIMTKLKDNNIEVYRTDENGTVIAICDGVNITFNSSPGSYTSESTGDKETNFNVDNDNYSENNNETTIFDSKIILDIDKVEEIVTIKNNSNEDVNLKGWILVSVKGNQRYTFEEYVIKVGESITVASGKSQGNIKWTSDNVWNNSSEDKGELLDASGKVVFSN